MERALSVVERQRFNRYHSRVIPFVQTVLCVERIELQDYISGTQRIEFYPSRFETASEFEIEDYKHIDLNDHISDLQRLEFYPSSLEIASELEIDDASSQEAEEHPAGAYEEALYQRLTSHDGFNLLILIGGLGAGKSTTVRYVENLLKERGASIRTAYPCRCMPICLRRPIKIDCMSVRGETTLKLLHPGILRAIRFKIYNRLIDEWLARNSLSRDVVREIDAEYKVLRRLIISNDLNEWADIERPSLYPIKVHSEALALERPLLKLTPTIEWIAETVRSLRSAVERITDPLLSVTRDADQALDFTSLLVGFYLSMCAPTHPNNLLVIDNIDQLPTEYIETLVHYMHDLAGRNEGMRILIPLRPSSIVPQGFVRDIHYMYHYGPNCFEMILDRVKRSILMRSRHDLASDQRLFQKGADNDELNVFLFVCYIYAMILSAGYSLSRDRQLHKGFVDVHSDHSWLHKAKVGPRAMRNLSQTLHALVGTSARYANTQLRRYMSAIYSEPWLLKEMLHRGVTGGAVSRFQLPYNLLIGTILGDWENEGDRTRLANLYRATTTSANPGWPSLTKLRILGLLSHKGRVRVVKVVDDLAQFGIPAERAIEALNYLNDKYRLLLWFSRNSNLQLRKEDLDQYAVIAEHGLSYLYKVAGDFEYIWFCARQIPPTTVGLSDWSFQNRLEEYLRIVNALGQTEWKQLTFRQCSSTTVVMRGEHIDKGELLTLWVLLSSLERALGSSGHVLRKREMEEVRQLVASICRLVITWIERYTILYGGSGYLIRYKELIVTVVMTLEGLTSIIDVAEAARVLALLQEAPVQQGFVWYGRQISAPAGDDFLSKMAELARGAIPMTREFEEALRRTEAARLMVWHFVKERRALHELLEKCMPTFTEIDRRVEFLAEQAGEVVQILSAIAATNTSTFGWFVEEKQWLKEVGSQLKDNRFGIRPGHVYDSEEMDVLKGRANNIMRIMIRLSQRLGLERMEHLDVVWQ
jgi:hypothetical protein